MSASPAPGRKGLAGGAIAAIVVASVLVLSGAAFAAVYFGTDTFTDRLSQKEAEARLDAAAPVFFDALENGTSDDMRLLTMDFEAESEDFDGDATTVTGLLQVEWALNGARHHTATISSGGFGVTMEAYCDSTRSITVFGGEAYVNRTGSDLCQEDSSTPVEDDPDDPFGDCFNDLPDDFTDGRIVRPDNGTVEAHLEEGTAEATIRLDADGRMVFLEATDDDCRLTVTADYGARRAIMFPSDVTKVPFDASLWETFGGGNMTVEILSIDTVVPRDEIEIRVLDDEDTVLATFAMETASGTSGGFRYEWLGDADADLEEGDSFLINRTGWTSAGAYQVILWDEWADAEEGSVTMPGPGLVPVVALLGAVLLARRR